MLIGSLGPPIGTYMIYRQYNKSVSVKSFTKLVFKRDIDKKVWLIFGLFTCWRFLMVWIALIVSIILGTKYKFE
jgi:hypothetical protein